MSQRLRAVLAANEDFAIAYQKAEPWAIKQAQRILAVDGLATTRHPDREFGDSPKNHCGCCPYRDGCMVCDLDYDPRMSDMVGSIANYELRCNECGFRDETETVGEAEALKTSREWHRNASPLCRGALTATASARHPLARRRKE